MTSGTEKVKQALFGALVRKGLRSSGSNAFVQEPRGKPKPKADRVECQHKIRVSEQVPHPRYGDKVPYFVTKIIPDPDCGCAPAVVDAPAVTAPEGTPEQGPQQCAALTKSGARCTRNAVDMRYCKQHGE